MQKTDRFRKHLPDADVPKKLNKQRFHSAAIKIYNQQGSTNMHNIGGVL